MSAFVEVVGESKGNSSWVLRRRRHLVLLAQNQTGLNNLFKLVSESYKYENFYRYPRMDYKMLKEHSEGIIASSACLGGVYAGCYWENRDEGSEAVLNCMREVTKQFQDILGDRWYCLLNTSDAANEPHRVYIGGNQHINKTKQRKTNKNQ